MVIQSDHYTVLLLTLSPFIWKDTNFKTTGHLFTESKRARIQREEGTL